LSSAAQAGPTGSTRSPGVATPAASARPARRGEAPAPPVTAGHTVVTSLRAHGADRVFCVAGESYLPVLDALYDTPDIDVVACRHEGSAGFMALADAKLTGKAGLCMVSRGPGAANAAIAVHAAAEDASPLILFVGVVTASAADREAFQDVDCARMFCGVAKAVWTLRDPGAAGEFVARAFRTAESGTPGPVVLEMPEDVLGQPDPRGIPTRRAPTGTFAPALSELGRVRELLATARRPLLLAGERLDTAAGRALLRRVAERHHMAVVTSNKHQHLLPNLHPNYAGHLHNATQPDQLRALDQADLVLAVGTRLDTVTTRGHRFPASPRPHQPLVHVYPDAARIGAYHQPECGFAGDPVAFLDQLMRRPPGPVGPGGLGGPGRSRAAWVADLHRLENDRAVWSAERCGDGVVFGAVATALNQLTSGEATIVVDSGTFTSWIYRYVRFGERGRLLGISSSAMGFGVGAGISAALRSRGEPVVVIIGDGGYLMNGGELITACSRRLPVVFIVANNNSYGTIRLHQEMAYPGRAIGTDLVNPDFARLAEAFGALGIRVQQDHDTGPSLAKALACGGPAVVEVRTSLQHITAWRTLGPAPGGGARQITDT
jgi:acetolactate synthase I/II/III large subunit